MPNFQRGKHQRLHQHWVLAVRGDIAALVRPHRFNLIHFVFSEADCAQLTDAKAETNSDEQGKYANYSPPLRTAKRWSGFVVVGSLLRSIVAGFKG
jgi:hypothetical protein